MDSSIELEDARDLELQSEIEAAAEAFLRANGPERFSAKRHYLSLLKTFAAQVFERQARIGL